MKLWNYTGKFLLFRWLFGSHSHDEATNNISNGIIDSSDNDWLYGQDPHIGFGNHFDDCFSNYNSQDYTASQGHGFSQSYDDYLFGQDDYGLIDDIIDDVIDDDI